MEILEKIDIALTVTTADRIEAVANPDIHDALDALEGSAREPLGRLVILPNGVKVKRSMAKIPAPGFVVRARV